MNKNYNKKNPIIQLMTELIKTDFTTTPANLLEKAVKNRIVYT